MSSLYPLLFLVPGGPFVLLLLVFLSVREHRRRRDGQPPRPSRDGSGRRAWLRRGFGLSGLVAAVAISFLFGQRAFVAFVPLAVCGYLAGVLLAELAMPRPTRTSVRRASLRRRSIDAYVPPALVWGWRVSVVVAVVALVGVGVTTGGSGGSPVTSCPVLFPVSWLGWGYGVPALVTLLAGAVLVEALLLRVPGRPRPDPAELPVPVDDGYRVASAHRALSAGYTLALIPIAELALLAAGSLGGGCAASHQAWATPMMVMLVVLGWAAGFGALVGVARFLTTPDWFPPSPVPGDES